MKKIILIFTIVFVSFLSSCTNDEPEIKQNPKECAVTYFENIILKKCINCINARYIQCEQDNANGLAFWITDFDDKYLSNYNVYRASFYDSNALNDFQQQLKEIFNCNFVYDGWWDFGTTCPYFCKIEHRHFDHNENTYYEQRFQRFHAYILGDEIKISTHPNHMNGFIYVSIKCYHGNHPHPQLKNAEIIY